ncbi:MAG: DUF3228 family protein [Candidatus Doudnabacteria bacterium]
MKLIGIGEFVKRQTPESRFSHFEGGWETLIAMVEERFKSASNGYREGEKDVPVSSKGFFTSVVEVTDETPLKATFEARRDGESKLLVVTALGGVKMPAKGVVDIVIRHRDSLDKDHGPVGDHEWEIISFDACPAEERVPMHPVAMARDMLGLPGGTYSDWYTAEQFAIAIEYWSTHAMRG